MKARGLSLTSFGLIRFGVFNKGKARYEVPGFSFVDKRFEISNLDIIRSIKEIIIILEGLTFL